MTDAKKPPKLRAGMIHRARLRLKKGQTPDVIADALKITPAELDAAVAAEAEVTKKARAAAAKRKRANQPAGSGESKNQGEAHGRSVLTERGVMKARALVKEGASVQDLANLFGVSIPTLSKAVRGRTWQHLPGALDEYDMRTKVKKVGIR